MGQRDRQTRQTPHTPATDRPTPAGEDDPLYTRRQAAQTPPQPAAPSTPTSWLRGAWDPRTARAGHAISPMTAGSPRARPKVCGGLVMSR
jgi:hypothetical protein